MTLQELKNQALKLAVDERLELIAALQQSLDPRLQSLSKQGLADGLIGIAKTDAPPPTDEEVEAMLDERLAQKYL
jgi:uncharacterized protein HemX